MNSIKRNEPTKRDVCESKLMELFADTLFDIDESKIPAINAHKDGTFGRSYLGYQLYTNGHNVLSTSTHHPRGLIYDDGETIFGVGVFFRPQEPETPCVHIVAPHGGNWAEKVEAFCSKIEEEIPDAKIFIRKLNYEQYKELGAVPNLNRIMRQANDEAIEDLTTRIARIKENPKEAGEFEKITYHGEEITEERNLSGKQDLQVRKTELAAEIEKIKDGRKKRDLGEEDKTKVDALQARIDLIDKEPEKALQQETKQISLRPMQVVPLGSDPAALEERKGQLEEHLDKLIAIREKMKLQPGNWTAIEYDPWISQINGQEPGIGAPKEDDTHEFAVVNLRKVLKTAEDDSTTEKGEKVNLLQDAFHSIDGAMSKNASTMAHRNYMGFYNFLERNNLELAVVPYSRELQPLAEGLVNGHFDMLSGKEKDVGSTKFDYINLHTTYPEDAKEAGLHMFICMVGEKGKPETRKPVSFFGFEEISNEPGNRTVGGYATITSYDPDILKGLPIADDTGFRNIATYATGRVFLELRDRGVDKVDLGGSETRDLDKGKQKYGAEHSETFWATRLSKSDRSWGQNL